ncbi:MAG: S8 family peptidase [Phycisphaerales bacterium]
MGGHQIGSDPRGMDAPMHIPHSTRHTRRTPRLSRLCFAALFIGGLATSLAHAAWVVLPPDPRIVYTGSVNTQGDAAIAAPAVRSTYSVDGSGIKIGIISDSFNALGGAPAAVASGNLPAGLTVLNDDTGSASTDEGRAMAEVIHDVAPGAQIYFHSAFNNALTPGPNLFPTQQSIALAINNMVTAGVKVIVNDAALLNEPFYQDGPVAKAVNDAKQAGVAFISAAGNYGNQSHQTTYSPSGYNIGGLLTKFTPGNTLADATLDVDVPANSTLHAVLQWACPYLSPSNQNSLPDYNLLALSSNIPQTATVIATSSRDQSNPWSGRQDNDADGLKDQNAYEILVIQNTGPSAETLQLAVTKVNDITPNRAFKIIISGGTITDPAFISGGGSYTIFGSAAADGSLTIGSIDYNQIGTANPLVETNSSQGPTQILYDTLGNSLGLLIRNSLDLVAPDNVDTQMLGVNGFDGTSAAASHAAAAAALLLQYAQIHSIPLSVDQLYALLNDNALDILTPGYDNLSGHGILNLDAAFAQIAIPEPATLLLLTCLAAPAALRRPRP